MLVIFHELHCHADVVLFLELVASCFKCISVKSKSFIQNRVNTDLLLNSVFYTSPLVKGHLFSRGLLHQFVCPVFVRSNYKCPAVPLKKKKSLMAKRKQVK